MSVPLHPHLLAYVFRHLRPMDRAETYAQLPDGIGADHLAHVHCGASRVGRVFLDAEAAPAAAIGAGELWPGVWSVWMQATPAWPQVWRDVFRYAAGPMAEEMRLLGAHRAQCWSLAGHEEAARFLRHLRFTLETPCPGFGRRGETFDLWSRVELPEPA